MNKTENKTYDLKERTALFSERVIHFCKNIKGSNIIDPIINQLIRAATSIGANYCEANGASSKKDFRNKIYICKKEAKETRYWLRLLQGLAATAEQEKECDMLNKEAHEFILIFSKIVSSIKN